MSLSEEEAAEIPNKTMEELVGEMEQIVTGIALTL